MSPLLNKLVKNWAKIVSGNTLAQVISLVAFAAAARALEVAELGAVAVVLAYTRVLDGLLNFQSAISLTKFGTDLLHAKEYDRFRALAKAALVLDLLTAAATVVLAVTGLALFARLLGVTDEVAQYGFLYPAVILTNVLGMPKAVLRMFDRFGTVVMRDIVMQTGRLLLTLLFWHLDVPAAYFLLAWFIPEALANGWLLLMGFRALHARGFRNVLGAHAVSAIRRTPGFRRTMWHTNITMGIRVASEEGDVVLVGGLLGSASAGIYRVGKSLAVLMLQVGRPVQQAVFPDIAKLWAESRVDRFWRFSMQVNLFSGLLGVIGLLLVWPFADWFITLTVGDKYLEARALFLTLLVAHIIYLCGITFLPMLTSLEATGRQLLITMVCTFLFFSVSPPLLLTVGLIGIAISHVVYLAAWWTLSYRLIRTTLAQAIVPLIHASPGVP